MVRLLWVQVTRRGWRSRGKRKNATRDVIIGTQKICLDKGLLR